MSYVSEWKYEDGIAEALTRYGLTYEEFEEAVRVLGNWLERRPEDGRYMVMGGRTLTPQELAQEVREHSQVGVSYVETFIAGAVSHKRLGLQRSLKALQKAG